MPYDKPKVTIDEEEYNLLKSVSEEIALYKKALCIAMSSGLNTEVFAENMHKEGIGIATQGPMTSGNSDTWESMVIYKY